MSGPAIAGVGSVASSGHDSGEKGQEVSRCREYSKRCLKAGTDKASDQLPNVEFLLSKGADYFLSVLQEFRSQKPGVRIE